MASKTDKPSSGNRRKPGPGKVLVTGISGNLGRLLTRHLHRVANVIGVDRRPFRNKPKDVEMVTVDLRRRAAEQIFRDHRIDAVDRLRPPHLQRRRHEEAHRLLREVWGREVPHPVDRERLRTQT